MNVWCRNCVYATDTGASTYCPFMRGMCVKLPKTMEKPNEVLLRKTVINAAYEKDKKRKGD